MFKLALAAVIAIGSTCSGAAIAGQADDSTPTVHVRYADLDLSRAEGMKALQHRLSAAIETVCGSPDSHDLAAVEAVSKCRRVATANTQTQVAALMAPTQVAEVKAPILAPGQH
jgi:UrcA family protein